MGIDIGPIEITDLLAISFDVGNTRSYSGSGITVNGLVSGIGVTLVNVPPPAEYVPEFATSLVAVYAVVAAVNDAELSYRASLKVLPVLVVKL